MPLVQSAVTISGTLREDDQDFASVEHRSRAVPGIRIGKPAGVPDTGNEVASAVWFENDGGLASQRGRHVQMIERADPVDRDDAGAFGQLVDVVGVDSPRVPQPVGQLPEACQITG